MRESEYKKIKSQYETLVRELDLVSTYIIDCLFQDGVLTDTEKEELTKLKTHHERNRRFLEILQTKEDAAYRMFHDVLRKHQTHLADILPLPGVPRTKSSRPSGSGVDKGFEDFTSTEVQEWLKPRLEKEQIPVSVLERISAEEIDGKAFLHMSENDLKEVFSDLKFGPRKKLALLRDEIVQAPVSQLSNAKPSVPRQQRKENARKFGSIPSISDKYCQGKILDKYESCFGSSMLDPARQFFPCSDDSERADICDFIAEKVTVFSAACLNDRRNGTIYFGVGNTDCEQFSHGQVLGIPLSPKDCEDAIKHFIRKRFMQETVEAALKCIRVVFVEVVLLDREEEHDHFVLEVDIEPKVETVENRAFFLNQDAPGEKNVLYRLHDGSPKAQDPDEVVKFSDEKSVLTSNRQQEEKVSHSRRTRNLPQLLKDFLCGGGDRLDGGYCPLLATGAVDPSQDGFKESYKFVSDLEWRCIFDFDARSAEKGLYQFLDEKEEILYKVKTAGDFISPSLSDASSKISPDEVFQDMNESELKNWIFCNGYDNTGEKGLNVAQWKRERSAGFKEAVRFFRNSIPEGRAVVVILLTAKDDVFIEASEELLLSFQDQWLMIAESEHLAETWIDGLLNRNVEVDRNRCLYSFSFADVSKAVHQLKGIEAVTKEVCTIRSSSGLDMVIPKKKVQELCDLEIVSVNECQLTAADGEMDTDELSRKQEEEFYKGNRATWWNFHFAGHVCPRDKLEDLKKHTRDTLNGDGDVQDNDSVGFVGVYHQPGAGGTTVAMNVVWDLHRDFKSCLVKQITKDTAKQILTLYEFPESEHDRRTPVLAMIDNEDEKTDDLKRDIEEECQTRGIYGLVCVFLICFRRMALPGDHQRKNVLLEQKLSGREKQFFIDKYAELKRKGRANLDSLLGLNIMKENFNETYIKNTVAQFVGLKTGHDRSVLKYTAILNCYDLLFRAIPVACFDPLLFSPNARRGAWEEKHVPEPLMLFTRNTKLSGRNKCLRITSQLLCKYILDELCGDNSHADLMETFLLSPTFKRYSQDFAFRELQNIVKDCMKKRGMAVDGKKRTKFSPFIQMLCDEGEIDIATRCIEIVFDRTGDAFLAQNIARIYIFTKNWDRADEWAQEATKKLPNNSFLWDTCGQICRNRLAEIREDCEESHSVDPKIVVRAVEYAQSGYEIFERVEELSRKEQTDPPNTSGSFGKMEIVLLLSKILKFAPSITSKDDLQGLLSGQRKLPTELGAMLQKHIPWLESLQESVFICLKSVEDQMMTTNISGITHTPTKFFLSKPNIRYFEDQLNNLFGEDGSVDNDPQKMTPEKRQKQMRALGGNSLYSVMSRCSKGEDGKETAKRILQLASLNLKGSVGLDSRTTYDLTMALASGLTLVCSHDDVLVLRHYIDLLEWSTELFERNKKPDWQKFINFDPYMFLLVFHWPTPNRQNLQARCEPAVLSTAIELARESLSKLHARQNRAAFRRRNNPIFFLTKNPDSNSVISKERLVSLCGKETKKRVDRLLRHEKAVQVVERFHGVLLKGGTEVKVELVSRQGNKSNLTIPLFVREGRSILWNKRIYFAIGVGLGGPTACGVADVPTPNRFVQSSRSGGQYGLSFGQPDNALTQVHRQIEEIQQKLGEIRRLRSKQTKTALEVQLICDEPGLVKRLKQLQQQRQDLELDLWL